MQVLPIKLPDELYQDLKLVSQAANTSMAEFIRQKIRQPIKTKIKVAKLKKEKEKTQIKENLAKVDKLVGGFNLGPGLTPKQMNKTYDKTYEKMLS